MSLRTSRTVKLLGPFAVMLVKSALMRTAPALFSMASSSMIRGSTGGTSNSGSPVARYGRRWLKLFLMHLLISGSDFRHGRMYSAATEGETKVSVGGYVGVLSVEEGWLLGIAGGCFVGLACWWFSQDN